MTDTGPGGTPAGRSPLRPYFAVVIGSGFGGAVTACRLAQARATAAAASGDERPICLLERGRRYGRHDFPRLRLPDYLESRGDRLTSKRVPDLARLLWTHDQGLWELRNLGELRVAQAAGLGGGSLIYANVHLRPPDEVFDPWPASCAADCDCARAPGADPPATPVHRREGLRPHYEQVAAMLDAAPVPPALRPHYPKTAAMAGAAPALAPGEPSDGSGTRFFYPPLAVRFPGSGPNRFGREQGSCTGCGNCTIGCQEGAKNTLDHNYLAVAEDLGVEVRTLCEVQWIRRAAGGTGCLEIAVVDHLHPGNEAPIYAEHVFLCAGAVGSTEILMRSREAPEAAPGQRIDAGARLGAAFFANGDNLAAVFDSDQPLAPSTGPTITTTLLHVGPPPRGGARAPWFLMQDGGLPPSLVEGIGLFRSPMWLARNRYLPPGFVPRPAPDAARSPRQQPQHASDALARGLQQLVPSTLDPLVARLRGLDGMVRQELWRVNARVIRKIDARLKGRLLTTPLAPLRALFASEPELVTLAGEALAEEYPVIADLFARERSIDLALSLARALLLGPPAGEHTGLLLVMGPDQEGRLRYRNGYLRIEWSGDNANLPLYGLEERLLRDAAAHLGGELRTNPDWTLGRTPVTAHAQGGCGMSASADAGVTRACGRLWACDRVHVMDAAAFPAGVGVNPSATIAAVAERKVQLFIRERWGLAPADYLDTYAGNVAPLTPERRQEIEGYDRLLPRALPPPLAGVPRARPVGLRWKERLSGHLAPADPAVAAAAFATFSRRPARAEGERRVDVRPFLAAEGRRPGAPPAARLTATLSVGIRELDAFLLKRRPRMRVRGRIKLVRHPGCAPDVYRVRGHLYLDLQRDPRRPASRVWAQERRLVAMSYVMVADGPAGGPPIEVRGRKLIADDPGMDVWADLSTVHVVARSAERAWMGVMRVRLADFLDEQLRKMVVESEGDPGAPPLDDVARGWAFLRFASFFVGGVKNVYSQWL